MNNIVEQINNYLKLAEELEENQFEALSFQDTQDIKILMKRVSKAIDVENYQEAILQLLKLDALVRTFKHESFEPDFYDFISDQDIWGKINQIDGELTSLDVKFLKSVKEILQYFLSVELK